MRGSHFGKMISMATFGESHGPALGVVIDGIPPKLKVSQADLQAELDRRAPGKSRAASSRREPDAPEILSGVLKDKTLGTPIAVIVRNHDQRSEDYSALKSRFRPGHADQTTLDKYGIRDHRGSGRASGRETVARVIAGYFASLVIPGIKIQAACSQIGPFEIPANASPASVKAIEKEIEKFLIETKARGESAGGRVRLTIDRCPKGLGEPVFDKLKADLAKGFLSIGGCTSFSYGLGEAFAGISGSQSARNRAVFGGIEGGISNGERITCHLTFKAPATVGRDARTGRHDPCYVPRVLPVVEAMAKIILADHFLRQKAYG